MGASILHYGANNSRILLALDGMPLSQAAAIAAELKNHVAGGKANDLIDEAGAGCLDTTGFAIRFADPKICDITNTVTNRMLKYSGHAEMVTVHAGMSLEALKAAAAAAEAAAVACIAVTVLTDIHPEECKILFGAKPERRVRELALRARAARVHGIVCSPHEVRVVRQVFPEAIIITPGVRSPGVDHDDQKRVDTPANAIKNGANYVVCGRQILAHMTSELRLAEVQRINREIMEVLVGI
jgi:orotidine-5'-phosphate decarboxylase